MKLSITIRQLRKRQLVQCSWSLCWVLCRPNHTCLSFIHYSTFFIQNTKVTIYKYSYELFTLMFFCKGPYWKSRPNASALTFLVYQALRLQKQTHPNNLRDIILWYYFTFWKEDPPHVEPPLLRQNLGAKTIWVDLTLKTTPPPLILDPIHLGRSALFLYYLSSPYLINKLLRNLTRFRQHVFLL